MKFLTAFLFLIISFSLHAKILEIDSIDPLWEEVSQATENTLVLFDIDDTLYICDDQILRPKGRELLQTIIDPAQLPSHCKGSDVKDHLMSIAMVQRGVSLIDNTSPRLVAAFKNKNCKVVALTAMQTGKLGTISSMEKWREAELKSFEIDFSDSFPHIPNQTLYIGTHPHPSFYNGILASSNASKGETLASFLKESGFTPDKVIFIDDLLMQLQSVEATLGQLNIPFLGFHYKEAYNLPGEPDPEVAKFQFAYLFKNQKWLSDKEASSLHQKMQELP